MVSAVGRDGSGLFVEVKALQSALVRRAARTYSQHASWRLVPLAPAITTDGRAAGLTRTSCRPQWTPRSATESGDPGESL